MCSKKANCVHRISKILLSIVVLALFSGVAFLNFYRRNFDELTESSRLVHDYLVVLAIAIVASSIAKAVFRGVPIFRIFLIAAVTVFMAFYYDEIKRLTGGGPFALSIACWACATILAAFVVGRFSTRTAFLPTMAIVGLVYVATPMTSLIHAHWRPSKPVGAAMVSLVARHPRNIYWIVLDGYPRADVLRQFFDFDNTPFLNGLRDLNFVVYDRAVASFPETIFSISSTLSLGFLADGESSTRILPQQELYQIVRGQSVVVNTIRSMGYHYIHFQNGYDNLTQCPLEGAICVRGNLARDDLLDEFDVALLSKTPLIDVIARGSANLAIDETPFLRGSVRDLTDKLAEVQAHGGPFFLYGHVLAPHPPIRFRRDCSTRAAAPDLLRWDPADKPAFLEQLICVNTEAIDLLGKIARSDPEAIVVVQSDHGTAFRGQFEKPIDAWDGLDLLERFGALNAIRMPARCAQDAEGSVDLINTFARVLNCISDGHLPDQASRQFVISHADMTSFHEYTGKF
jgi:hypothetical protein